MFTAFLDKIARTTHLHTTSLCYYCPTKLQKSSQYDQSSSVLDIGSKSHRGSAKADMIVIFNPEDCTNLECPGQFFKAMITRLFRRLSLVMDRNIHD